jgi:16S rRNA (guanine527-N7)-methyltransferase
MQPARIAELLEPFLGPAGPQSLSDGGDLDRISTYIDLLLRWNARINLTAIRNEEEIVTRHFGESLFAARQLFPRDGGEAGSGTLADVGSGAGFPGIPIKLWAPHVHVTLIESNQKKATFLREAVRALTLMDIDVQNSRAESLGGRQFDVVTLRAVERLESILPIAAGLTRPTGRLVLLIGSSQLPQAQSVLPGFDWSEAHPIPESRSRVVAIARHPGV